MKVSWLLCFLNKIAPCPSDCFDESPEGLADSNLRAFALAESAVPVCLQSWLLLVPVCLQSWLLLRAQL